MSEQVIIYQNERVKLVETQGEFYLDTWENPILVLPYTLADNGYPEKIGVINIDDIYSPIGGIQIEGDSDIFWTARRILLDKSGFIVENLSNWDFIGTIKKSEYSINESPAFSVDITGLIAEEREDEENKTKFHLVSASDILEGSNCILHSLFLKTFQTKNLK